MNSEAKHTDETRTALVLKSTGSWYSLVDQQMGFCLQARLSGKIRLEGRRSTNPVVVGDVVDYQVDGSGAESSSADTVAVITSIHPRRNYMIRRSSNLSKESHIIAANIDQAFVVVTLDFPVTRYEFIDRFLVTAEAYHIPATIVLNKTDLYTTPKLQDELLYFHYTYRLGGYEILEVSASRGEGVDLLRDRIKGKTSLFSGNSGVGKSTLIRAIDPNLDVLVGEISEYHKKGKHTTTFSEMFPLSEGGYIIDTPGIKGFGLIDIEPEEAARYFPDLFRFAPDCSFYNCTHTHEPDCAVKAALENHEISDSRYISYLKLLEEDEKYRK